MDVGSKKEYLDKDQIIYDFDSSEISLEDDHLKIDAEIIPYEKIQMLRLRHYYKWWFGRGFKRLEIYMGDVVYCIRLKLRFVPLSKAMVHYENEKIIDRFKNVCLQLHRRSNHGSDFWLVMFYNKYVYYFMKYTIYAVYTFIASVGIIVLIKVLFAKFGFAKALVIPKLGLIGLNLSTIKQSLRTMSPPSQITEDNFDDAFQKFMRLQN